MFVKTMMTIQEQIDAYSAGTIVWSEVPPKDIGDLLKALLEKELITPAQVVDVAINTFKQWQTLIDACMKEPKVGDPLIDVGPIVSDALQVYASVTEANQARLAQRACSELRSMPDNIKVWARFYCGTSKANFVQEQALQAITNSVPLLTSTPDVTPTTTKRTRK